MDLVEGIQDGERRNAMPEIISILEYNNSAIPIERVNQYISRPPLAYNLDIVPERWRNHWIKVAGREQAVLPPGYLCSLKNATVFNQGAILTPNGKLIEETLPVTPIHVPEVAAKNVPGHVALLRKPGDNNYGHWLIELLPRVREFRSIFGRNVRFAVPGHPLAMRRLRLDTLAWLGVEESDVIWLSNDPVMFDEVSFITTNSIHSHTHDFTGVREIARHATHKSGEYKPGRRLYIGRPNILRRGLTNDDEIVGLFEEAGFETIIPSAEISANEQVELFRSADFIAGVTGAALTNLIWARPGTQLLSLNPNIGFEFFFWDLANIMNVRLSIIFGNATDKEKGVHSDFFVDPQLVETWLYTIDTKTCGI